MGDFRGNAGNGEVTDPEGDSGTGAGAPTASAMRRTLARARDGKPLDVDEATVLLHARGEDLNRLLDYASRTRDAGLQAAKRAGVITYSRKVFIPLTRLCRDRCGYCTFATVPHRLHDLYLEPDKSSKSPARGPNSAARKPCSPSATNQKTGGSQPGSGWTSTATTTPCPTSGRWRSASWRRPACSRT